MRSARLQPSVAIAFVVAAAVAVNAQDAAPAASRLPVSVERIRQALQRTPTLRITTPPPDPPTYRVQIIEHPYFRTEPHQWTYDGGGYAVSGPNGTSSGMVWSPPLIQVDALPMLAAAKQALGERAARREVQQAMAEFCAQYSCVLK